MQIAVLLNPRLVVGYTSVESNKQRCTLVPVDDSGDDSEAKARLPKDKKELLKTVISAIVLPPGSQKGRTPPQRSFLWQMTRARTDSIEPIKTKPHAEWSDIHLGFEIVQNE